jgi:shikimate kinase/3-dehydroquinate synthase
LASLTLPRRGAVVCVGFMGAGKSTAARAAAAELGLEAVDVDHVIEARLGKPIERVFTEDGEAAFRAAEVTITRELLASSSESVLALGGGALGDAGVGAVHRHRASAGP